MHHPSSLLLLSWLLLIPPSSYDSTWGTGKVFDTDKPLSEWINAGTFDSEDECAAAREQNRVIMALRGSGDMERRFALGKCVSK
ncbi:MAG TPA: hypothetical protein VGA73_17345 [Candidatus Binatia bacterium]